MKLHNKKYIATSLAIISCLYCIPHNYISAHTLSNQEESKTVDNKNIEKEKDYFNLFNDDNCKSLSAEQRKKINEYKEKLKKGERLSNDELKFVNEIMHTIIKNKLGDENYKLYISIISKKTSGKKLNDEDLKKLKEFEDIISSKNKMTSSEILKQFLR